MNWIKSMSNDEIDIVHSAIEYYINNKNNYYKLDMEKVKSIFDDLIYEGIERIKNEK